MDDNDYDMMSVLEPDPPPDDPPPVVESDEEAPDGDAGVGGLQPGFEESQYEEYVNTQAFKLWKKQRGDTVIDALGKFNYCSYSTH